MQTNLLVMIAALGFCCNGGSSQPASAPQQVGGRCEGCEAIYESPLPFHQLDESDSTAGFTGAKQPVVISGRVFMKDGTRPAAGVVIYFYHTDPKGIYPVNGGEKGWARRHGYLRGWVKTNARGEYRIYTSRPGSYPNSNNPQHIHMTVKEPDKNEYWIDEIQFLDDPLLTPEMQKRDRKRGGSGLVQLRPVNGVLAGKRDIILGMNVEQYP